MKKRLFRISLFILMLWQPFTLWAQQQRFPKPEFESGYVQPQTVAPTPSPEFMGYLDVLILLLCLVVITWFILKKRSRKGVVGVSIFSVLYFGFLRDGCVCSVGSLQNITLALFNPQYHIPFTVVAFFVLPLLFTLFFGRTFCAGVCPLGAIQDLCLVRPLTLKKWVQKVLGLIPFIYLGLSILYAATATDFIICRYDPFVGIFRLDGTFMMLAIGVIFLLISAFIARPYCRFLCPYGVLLNIASRVSKNHLTITPSSCNQCRLCEDACPMGAILKPVPVREMEDRHKAVKRYILLGVLIPFLMIIGGWGGASLHERLASVNPTVKLAHQMMDMEAKSFGDVSEEITAFKTSGKPVAELYQEAADVVSDFYVGGWLLGGFLGLVFGLTLLRVSRFRFRDGYTPDKGNCLSCARCVDYCPVTKNDVD